MTSFHWLAWLSTCFCLGGLVFAWAIHRLKARISLMLVLLGLCGGVAATLISTVGDALTRVAVNHLPGTLALHWQLIEWAVGLREEGLKLLAFVVLVPKNRRADGLLGMVLIALGFAVTETWNLIPRGAGATETIVVSALHMLQGAPFHVWTGLCDAILLMLAARDRCWLLLLPLPPLLHTDYDFTPGLSNATPHVAVQILILLFLGIGTLTLMSRIVTPPVGVSPTRIALAVLLGVIPMLFAINEVRILIGTEPTVRFNPPLAAVLFPLPWALIGADLFRPSWRLGMACGRANVPARAPCRD